MIAGCLNAESDGAKKLINFCGNRRMAVIQIDIRNNNSIEAAQKNVDELVVRHGLSMEILNYSLVVKCNIILFNISFYSFSE